MPIRLLDRAALKCEARELIRTARVSPIKLSMCCSTTKECR